MERKASPNLTATRQKSGTMWIGWTGALAAAVVARWKMLRQENQVAMSAEIASEH